MPLRRVAVYDNSYCCCRRGQNHWLSRLPRQSLVERISDPARCLATDVLPKCPITLKLQFVEPLVRRALVRKRHMLVKVTPDIVGQLSIGGTARCGGPLEHTRFHQDQSSGIRRILRIVKDCPDHTVLRTLTAARWRLDVLKLDLNPRSEIRPCLLDQ